MRRRPRMSTPCVTSRPAFLRAYEVLGDDRYLRVAENCGQMLVKTQDEHGAWCQGYIVMPDRSTRSLPARVHRGGHPDRPAARVVLALAHHRPAGIPRRRRQVRPVRAGRPEAGRGVAADRQLAHDEARRRLQRVQHAQRRHHALGHEGDADGLAPDAGARDTSTPWRRPDNG